MADSYFNPNALEIDLEINKVLNEMLKNQDVDIFNRFKSELKDIIPALPSNYIFELIAILREEVFRRSCVNTEIEFKPDVSETTNYKYGLEGYCISDTIEDQIT